MQAPVSGGAGKPVHKFKDVAGFVPWISTPDGEDLLVGIKHALGATGVQLIKLNLANDRVTDLGSIPDTCGAFGASRARPCSSTVK